MGGGVDTICTDTVGRNFIPAEQVVPCFPRFVLFPLTVQLLQQCQCFKWCQIETVVNQRPESFLSFPIMLCPTSMRKQEKTSRFCTSPEGEAISRAFTF